MKNLLSLLKVYNEKYYKEELVSSRRSAKEVVPLILELTNAKSVIDIGCGLGAWLASFKEHGVEDILGIDGSWVDLEKLQIPTEHFFSFDLTKPFRINRRFDLVVSLEVAEHIPEKFAETLIDTLVSLGDVVMFSAAIPYQGGERHVNCQWQSYWAKLFLKRGYVAIDCIRKKIWMNDNVDVWYSQNILMFVRKSVLKYNSFLKREFENTNTCQLSMVHPKIWLATRRRIRDPFAKLFYKAVTYAKKKIHFVRMS